jgi:hypothetical protein
MQRSQSTFGSTDRLMMWNWPAVVLTLHAVLFLTLVGIAVGYPGASDWIAAAARAEFADALEPSVAPTQFAQPVDQMRIVSNK